LRGSPPPVRVSQRPRYEIPGFEPNCACPAVINGYDQLFHTYVKLAFLRPLDGQGGLGRYKRYATTRRGYILVRGIVGTEQERKRAAPQRQDLGCAPRGLAMAPDSGLTAAEVTRRR